MYECTVIVIPIRKDIYVYIQVYYITSIVRVNLIYCILNINSKDKRMFCQNKNKIKKNSKRGKIKANV